MTRANLAIENWKLCFPLNSYVYGKKNTKTEERKELMDENSKYFIVGERVWLPLKPENYNRNNKGKSIYIIRVVLNRVKYPV